MIPKTQKKEYKVAILNNEIEFAIEARKVKVHGWVWPLHIYQIFTWTIGLIEIFYMFGEVFPYINLLPMFIIFMIIFIGIVIALIYLDTALCLTDPTDPIIYEERLKYQQELWRTNNENSNDQIISKISKFNKIDTRDYINSDFIYVCDICLTHVQNKTKHWREWNRWVSGFDHHWKWLNNWIGDKNYKKFMTLIILYFSSNIYLLIMYIIHLSNILKYWSKPFNQYYSPIISK